MNAIDHGHYAGNQDSTLENKNIPYSGKVWREEIWQIDSFWAFGKMKFGKLIDQPKAINNFNGFSLANYGWFAKLSPIKLSYYTVSELPIVKTQFSLIILYRTLSFNQYPMSHIWEWLLMNIFLGVIMHIVSITKKTNAIILY